MAEIKFMSYMFGPDSMKPRSFALPYSQQRLVFMPEVLVAFSHFRQVHDEPEAGGLLFAQFDLPTVRVPSVTTPHKSDQRWRTLFIPNRILQRHAIRKYFKQGYHFIGEWHTHPAMHPIPSKLDLESMRDAFLKSSHELQYFIMVIVGNRLDRLVLWVSAHDDQHIERLNECR
jgi:integrative and conjugative element protein (TIGR02256 family)